MLTERLEFDPDAEAFDRIPASPAVFLLRGADPESQRTQSYFQTRGDSLLRELSLQRDEASSNTDFEGAAVVHLRIDKLKALLAQLPEIVHRLDLLNGVMVQTSAHTGSVNLFQIRGARIFGPVSFAIQSANQFKSQSMEARIQETLSSISAADPTSPLEISEHLAILRRWFYRSSRTGEIFFADENGVLPMRRVVRGVSRVFSGGKVEADSQSQSATKSN